MAEILYRYCYDENDELICIDDINEVNRHNHKYKCISCGREMRVWLQGNGERSRRSHFGHKANCSCNSETYLHKLAKIRIKECFDRGNLTITYHDYVTCSRSRECRMFDAKRCYDEIQEKYNLCKFYDTCEEEKGIDGVDGIVADLRLTNSDKSKTLPPVLIEVYVKHKCSEEKINKGLKIFETKQIQSEQDIDDIVNGGFVTSNPDLSRIYNCGIGYNITPQKKYEKNISRFVLFPTWGTKIEDVSCKKRSEISYNNSLLELNINSSKLAKLEYLPKMIGLLYLAHKVHNYKNCHLCKYLSSDYNYQSLCPLHKKFGTPQSPRESYGMRCDYFCIRDLYRSISVEELCECIERVKEEPIIID